MFFRFRPDSPDLFEPAGNKLTCLLGSLFITAAICSVTGSVIAAEGDDSQEAVALGTIDPKVLSEDQFKSFSDEQPLASSQDGKSAEKNKGEEQKAEGANGQNGAGTSLLGVGVSEMMPTEFYIESDQYGTGQYRRYIGYIEDEDGTRKKSGKLVQEILVSRDDADAIEKLPKLRVDKVPQGLQVTGFVAVKMWLSVVLTTYKGCIKKPKMTRDTWDWAPVEYEHESSRNDCALSFRLTVDTNAPGQMRPHKSKVFLTGELCRYPEGNTQFSSEKDDAECVTLPTVTVSKKERLFLSEADEKLRAVRSILIAQAMQNKGVASFLQSINPWAAEDKTPDLGDSIDLFSKFVGQLSSMSDTAYNWQIDPEYLGDLEGATFHEVITGVRYDDVKLKAFLAPYEKEGGFKASVAANYQSAGLESTVSEMRVADEESEAEDAEKVAYVFKLESKKGMSFEHEESGELIQLLDNSELSPMGRKNIQLREVQAKLNRCQVQRIDAESRCKELEDEKASLVKQLENAEKRFTATKKLLDEKVEGLKSRLSLLEGQRDLERSAEEMDVVQEERDKHRIAIDDLKAKHEIAINGAKRSHELELSDAKAEYQGRINKISQDLTNARKDAKTSEAAASRLEKSERKLGAKVTKLEKELKEAEDELNDRVSDANKAYRDQVQALKKENAKLEMKSESKGLQLRDSEKAKQQALREQGLRYQADLENLRGTLAGDMAEIRALIKDLWDARGFRSDVEDPTHYLMPSFEVVNDANGRPRPAVTRYSKRSN